MMRGLRRVNNPKPFSPPKACSHTSDDREWLSPGAKLEKAISMQCLNCWKELAILQWNDEQIQKKRLGVWGGGWPQGYSCVHYTWLSSFHCPAQLYSSVPTRALTADSKQLEEKLHSTPILRAAAVLNYSHVQRPPVKDDCLFSFSCRHVLYIKIIHSKYWY